ncbi:MAG: diacylglycerol kinase family protein [Spirochaetales bacterium]
MEISVATFSALFSAWLRATRLFPDRSLHIDLLVNPHAGAFRHKGRLSRLIQGLVERPVVATPGRKVTVSIRLTSPELPPMVAHPVGPDLQLVIVAGGDGTSRAALISALGMTDEEKAKLLFFRLPLGTGNDAADADDWNTCLDVLSGDEAPGFEPRPLDMLEVRAPRLGLHHSFNIGSVGLDAWVVSLTNRFRKVMPGNTYSLMVDAATLFYEWATKMVVMDVELTQDGKPVAAWKDQLLLVAFGTSGHRTYGAGKHILPDEDNLVLAHRVNLLTKLSYREPIYRGTHRGLPGIEFARGDSLSVHQSARLPLQLDGEEFWLEPGDFPLTMKRVASGLRTLSRSH